MSLESRLQRFQRLSELSVDINIFPLAQRELWSSLSKIPENFVLYGGTALALHLGHRTSVDFDFFAHEPFLPGDLQSHLNWLDIGQIDHSEPNNLSVTTTGDVHLSFFGNVQLYTVRPPEITKDNGLVIASMYDLAGTKLKAILDRSEWKDYFDIYSILKTDKLTLVEILSYTETIFTPNFSFPFDLALKSLEWFKSGSAPKLSEEIKDYLKKAVQNTYGQKIPMTKPYRKTIRP